MVTGAIIGGGLSQRLNGQDKLLVDVGGRRQLDRLLDALRLQTSGQILVSNRGAAAYPEIRIPVISDQVSGAGPLAGVHAALQHCGQGDVLCVPADAVRLPQDLYERLQQARSRARAAVACVHDGLGLQPVCCLLPASLAGSAQQALAAGQLALHRWLKDWGAAEADFSHWPRWAWSFNTPEELQQIRMNLNET